MNRGYLLDTNVLSELMRDAPATQVLTWFGDQAHNPIYTSAITQAEILTGIALLPEGKRRTALFAIDLAGRCLDFDGTAAQHYAVIVAQRTRMGQPISTEDAQIAAIAIATGHRVVTRNTNDFSDIEDLVVVNPWQAH